MANAIDYIKKYGEISFHSKPFTEVDNLIFSELAYLDFSNTDLMNRNMPLAELAEQFFAKNKFRDVARLGVPHRDAYKILEHASRTVRFRDVLVMNYEYKAGKDYQFGAVCFLISKNLMYLSYEGTDQLISGWREDFEFSYRFPVKAEQMAIDYANRCIRAMGPEVIMGGHSKGGHLALVASMYMKRLKQRKIVRIFNNDGPGLRWAEFTSYRYAQVRSRYEHIVPANSTIGILLRNDKYKIVRSSAKALLAHALLTWEIEGDHLRLGKELIPTTVRLRDGLLAWLDDHDDADRERMVNVIFGLFEENGIDETMDIRNLKNIVKVIRSVKSLDDESRELAMSFLYSAFGATKKPE